MEATPPDRADEEHRRRELDFMRELEEQSGKRQPSHDEAAVRAAGEPAGDPPAPGEPAAR